MGCATLPQADKIKIFFVLDIMKLFAMMRNRTQFCAAINSGKNMTSTHENDQAFLNAEAVSRLLGLHIETVRRLVREGQIPAFKAGRSWRFSRRKIQAWAEGHPDELRPQHILVVDDERDVCEVVRLTLERAGYRVDTARDGEKAISLLRATRYDLILLDLKLPHGSGVDVIREVRAVSDAIPVIIITGYPDSDLMHEAMKYSPLLVLAKPVDPQTLRKTVAGVVSGLRATTRSGQDEGSRLL
jgi:excisionase family DNA binding protein